ncbi:dihydroorotase [PVC group bacterium]|nr:dihydroorotase [PVC group bacterium]
MSDINKLTIPVADDFHVHLRQGDLMNLVVPLLQKSGIGRCLVMPNTRPPTVSVEEALIYKTELQELAPNIEFLMTLYLTPAMTPDIVRVAVDAGITAAKCYPQGVTTNSENGVEDLSLYNDTFAAMSEYGLTLCIHGEMPVSSERGIDMLNAEQRFLPELERLHKTHPELRIVFEHVSSAEGVECVKGLGENVAATITPHHLDLVADDWKHNIHNFCKPAAKHPRDRDALWAVVKLQHQQFFLGSDSAPHTKEAKETGDGCAGIFTTPLLLPYLADSFEKHDCIECLSDFVSEFGRSFYGLPPLKDSVTLNRKLQNIPETYGSVVPYRAGEQCGWQVGD